MDLFKAIEELRAERRRVDQAIAYLEDLVRAQGPVAKEQAPRTRSKPRKKPAAAPVPATPVLTVSEDMVQYWRDHPEEAPRNSPAGEGSNGDQS